MRIKLLAVVAGLSLVALLGATSARADQITLGDSCSGTLSVNPVGPSVGGSVSNCGATWEHGSAPFTDVGVWSYSSGTGFSSGTYVDATSSLSGTISWTNYSSSSNTLDGFITVTAVSGFNNEYTVGGVYSIDLTFQPGSCTLNSDQIYAGCKVSSGEIPTATPEPGTLTLLGTGFLTMAGFIRRKFRA